MCSSQHSWKASHKDGSRSQRFARLQPSDLDQTQTPTAAIWQPWWPRNCSHSSPKHRCTLATKKNRRLPSAQWTCAEQSVSLENDAPQVRRAARDDRFAADRSAQLKSRLRAVSPHASSAKYAICTLRGRTLYITMDTRSSCWAARRAGSPPSISAGRSTSFSSPCPPGRPGAWGRGTRALWFGP